MSWEANQHDRDWPFDLLATDFQLNLHSTALLIIDMHAKDVEMDPASELATARPEIREYWNARLSESVIPNIRQLIDVFRARQRPVVYTRNGHLTSSGAEMTRRLRTERGAGEPREFVHPSQVPGYEIDSRIAPGDEDLVVDKLTSGAFTASILDHALRNMEVRGLVIAGILTDMCVLGTARAAAEIGYDSLICEDACATLTPRAP